MKRIISPLILAVLALALVLSPTPAFGKGAKKPTPPPRHTVIASISSDSITVDTGRTQTTYAIDKNTVLLYEGKKAVVSDLQAGMRVSVSPDLDGKTANSINASPAPAVKAAASPTPKK